MDINAENGSGDKAAVKDQSTKQNPRTNSPGDGSSGEMAVVNGGVGREEEEEEEDTWEWFNILRTMCDTPKRIGVCLEISTDLVSETR